MKSKLTIVVVVALVLGVLYVGDSNNWFRRVKAQSGPPVYAECERLRSRGDLGARACYQKLAQSRDPYIRAEGQWGLDDLYAAADSFLGAINSVKNDPNRLVRRGRMFMMTDQNDDALQDFEAALKIDPAYVPALMAKADVLAGEYDQGAVKIAEQALMIDPKLYRRRN
jgi:tetratricopeptide (TPR) repeat protein